jgi:serine/threonine protein kinase
MAELEPVARSSGLRRSLSRWKLRCPILSLEMHCLSQFYRYAKTAELAFFRRWDGVGVLEELQPGDLVQVGPYRLTGVLGAGGMGRVFLGWSSGGRPVAVKVIKPELAAGPEFRARFRREVAAARTVSGLYTALLIDADVDGPVPWLATAYVDGPSLAEAVASYGPLPAKSVLALAAGLAEALAAVHAAGLVHRDLKPSNVLLASDGPRVIDFGISRIADTTTLTDTGQSIGSPGYLSPEQAIGNEIGPPSDIFSLGAVLAFAASGSGPFGTGSPPVLVYRVVHQSPTLEGVPAELRSLIGRCLAKDPGDRPSASDLLADLAGAQPGAQWLPERITATLAEFAVPALTGAASGSASEAVAHDRTATSAASPGRMPSALSADGMLRPTSAAGGSRSRWFSLLRRSRLAPVALASAVLAAIVLASILNGPGALKGGSPVKSASPFGAARHQATSAASTPSPVPRPTSATATVGVACSFIVNGAMNCSSTNPRVLLYADFGNDTSGCSWVRNITWGDGTSSDGVVVYGGPAGPKLAASHTYSAPGSYTIYFGGEVTQGSCNILTPTFRFKFLPR